MRPPAHPRSWLAALLASVLAAGGAAPQRSLERAAGVPLRPLPAIVFVRRHPASEPGAIVGFGPHHRGDRTGGSLLIRRGDGSVRDVLPQPVRPFDVSHPSISPDGRTAAFAACVTATSRWRIWTCDLRTGAVRGVTVTDAPASASREKAPPAPPRTEAFDDLAPCWISDRALCFSSTRCGGRAEYADVPVTNLYVVSLTGGAPRQITFERNGADDPTYDARRDRIVYARWWFNRWLPTRSGRSGLTLDRALAVPGDTVNVWQPAEIDRDGNALRLAAGGVRPRRASMAYEPCVLPDGDLLGVYALNTGLSPSPGPIGIQRLPRAPGPSRRLAGALIDGESGVAYGTPRGLAAPSACAPAALPDGRIVLAYDPGGHGDFGVYVMDPDGERLTPVFDVPGTAELDPAPVVPWPSASHPSASTEPAPGTFTFFCRNLFASGPLDSPIGSAPPATWPLTIRFYAVRAPRRADDIDTVALIREAKLRPDGSIRESGLPADTPMFEQVVGADGVPLITAHGAAHVAGFNFGHPGQTLRCVGCHPGHSMLPAEGPDARFLRFDAARSAEVTVSSRMPGVGDPGGATDGATRAPGWASAWCARSDSSEWIRLTWRAPIRVHDVVLYAPADARLATADRGAGTLSTRIDRCELRLSHKTELLARRIVGSISMHGTRVPVGDVLCDELEVRGFVVRGSVRGAPRVALAEIEANASLAPAGLNEPAGPYPTPAAGQP